MNITIKTKEKEFVDMELHYSIRVYVFYEAISGGSIDYSNFNSYKNLVDLFYATVLATFQYNRETVALDYNDFYDWLDGQPQDILAQFSDWFVSHIEINSMLADTSDDTKKETTETKGRKKKSTKNS